MFTEIQTGPYGPHEHVLKDVCPNNARTSKMFDKTQHVKNDNARYDGNVHFLVKKLRSARQTENRSLMCLSKYPNFQMSTSKNSMCPI